MSLEELVRRLQKRNMTACATDTGITYQAVINIARGVTKNPSLDTFTKLVKWVEEN